VVAWELFEGGAKDLQVEVGHVCKGPLLQLKLDVFVPEHVGLVVAPHISHPLLKVPACAVLRSRDGSMWGSTMDSNVQPAAKVAGEYVSYAEGMTLIS